jgi:type IV pilus biogenesis protein CpaD/CtpE
MAISKPTQTEDYQKQKQKEFLSRWLRESATAIIVALPIGTSNLKTCYLMMIRI